MADTQFSKLHILMFPWFATGHMTPFLHISNELASRGHKITFLLPNKALSHLNHLNRYPKLISFQILTVPPVSGLPPATETASDIPISLTHLLAVAFDLTRPQLESIIQSTRFDFVFYDFAYWVPEIAGPLGIKSISYTVVSAASIAIALIPGRHVSIDNPLTEDDLRDPPIDYPSTTVVLRGGEIRSLLFLSLPFGDGITFHERMTAVFNGSDAIAMRTCEEIEGEFCRYIGKQFGKRVLLTGPVLGEESENEIKKTTGLEDQKWVKWLDRFKSRTVIFCAFGSQLILEKEQFEEIILGLEETGLPFLAALKPPIGCSSMAEAIPEGFEERVKERGIVYGDWVEQPLILKHESVGCFVSHCGFGSMWESLMSDCQIVLVPQLGDQILNTKLLVHELKVAVEVKKEEDGKFRRQSLREAIDSVMIISYENGRRRCGVFAEMVRENHQKWKGMLTKPGFMKGYVDGFVQKLEEEESWRKS